MKIVLFWLGVVIVAIVLQWLIPASSFDSVELNSILFKKAIIGAICREYKIAFFYSTLASLPIFLGVVSKSYPIASLREAYKALLGAIIMVTLVLLIYFFPVESKSGVIAGRRASLVLVARDGVVLYTFIVVILSWFAAFWSRLAFDAARFIYFSAIKNSSS